LKKIDEPVNYVIPINPTIFRKLEFSYAPTRVVYYSFTAQVRVMKSYMLSISFIFLQEFRYYIRLHQPPPLVHRCP